jgi:Tol biopolymer transport system component
MNKFSLYSAILVIFAIFFACQPVLQVSVELEPTPVPSNFGKLAYIQGGDVWVMKLPEGESHRLTHDGINHVPRWSPTGSWLAFRKGDFSVWLIDAGGNLAWPLNEGATVDFFAWSPLRNNLAYTTGGTLFIVDEDGKNLRSISSQYENNSHQNINGQIGRIAWNPDGTRIAYEWWEQPTGQSVPTRGIRLISLDGDRPINIYAGDASLAGWTMDGRYLLFWKGVHLSPSLAADGVSLFTLSIESGTPVLVEAAMLPYLDFLTFDPTGADQLLLISGDGREAWTNKMLWLRRVSSGEESLLTSPDLAISSPAWSQNGSLIAFVAMPDPKSETMLQGEPAKQALMQRKIWIKEANDQSAPTQLTNDPVYRDEVPLWSNDSSSILFARFDRENRASLWLVTIEDRKLIQVVDELTPNPGWIGFYGHVEWGNLLDWWRGAPYLVTTLPSDPSPTMIPLPTKTEALAPTSTEKPTLAPSPLPPARLTSIVWFLPEGFEANVYLPPLPLSGQGVASLTNCPNPLGLEEFAGFPVETAIDLINNLNSGDMEQMRRASDPAMWSMLQADQAKVQNVTESWFDGMVFRADASPYAEMLSAVCGEDVVRLSWSATICRGPCQTGGSESLKDHYFFFWRNGRALIWLVW